MDGSETGMNSVAITVYTQHVEFFGPLKIFCEIQHKHPKNETRSTRSGEGMETKGA